MPIAEHDVPIGIPGMELEPGRGLRGQLLDVRRVQANARRGAAAGVVGYTFDARPLSFEPVDGCSAQDLDADVAQDPQPRLVDRLDVVGAQDLDRRERVDDSPPGQPRDAAPGAPLAPWPASNQLGVVGHQLTIGSRAGTVATRAHAAGSPTCVAVARLRSDWRVPRIDGPRDPHDDPRMKLLRWIVVGPFLYP
jgi:hypothetical protein